MSNYRTLMEQAGPVIRALKLTSNAAQIGGAATSIMIVGIVAYARFLEVLPPTWAKVFTISTVALFLAVVEGGLRTFAPFTLDELFTFRLRKEENTAKRTYRAAFMLVCLLLVMALAFGTGSTSWIGRRDMAEVATPPPQTADLASIAARQEKNLSRMDSTWDAKINHLQATESERIKQAEKEARRLVNVAIKSKGPKMAELYIEGNGWAAEQLKDPIGRAQIAGEGLIRKAREATENAEMEKRRALTVHETDARQRFTSIEAQNQDKQGNWADKYDRNSRIIGFFGVGCLLIFFLSQVLLSLARVVSDVPTFADERGADPRAGKSPTPQGPGILTKARQAWSQVTAHVAHSPPEAQGPAPIDIRNGAPWPEPQTRHNSPNMSGPTGHNSPIMTEQLFQKGPPDNTGKKYQKDARVSRNREQIRVAYQALLAERNAPPYIKDVAEVTGLGEKTVSRHLKALGLWV